jgi:hypothetical protein
VSNFDWKEVEPYRQIVLLRELGGGSLRSLRFRVLARPGKQRLRSRRSTENDRRERQNDFTVVEVEIRAAAFPPLTLSARQSLVAMPVLVYEFCLPL